jgi:protoporphyrinogen oxidase
MVPYNRKLWGVEPEEMLPDWCGSFVPRPKIEEVLAGARRDDRTAFGYNTTFLYPRVGGIQVLAEALAKKIPKVQLGVSLEKVFWKKRQVVLSSGETAPYSHLISPLPLPELIKRLDPFPMELRRPLGKLRWSSVLCVNLGVARPKISDKSWIYFPENKFVFYRVGFPMNFTPHVVPKGCSSMYVEVSYPPGECPTDPKDQEKLFRRIRRGLLSCGILRPTDKLPVVSFLPIRYAYVIYDPPRAESVQTLLGWLKEKAAAQSIGRYGAWKYSFMEEAILDGKKAAESISG